MILWGEIRCLSLIGVKGLKSHGHAEKKKPRTISARGKKCWETGSVAWYLFCIVFMVQYNTHNINYKSLLFGKVCRACQKNQWRKKVMFEHFREFLEWLQCPTREELHEWGTQKTYFLSCDKCHWVTCTFNVQKVDRW